MVSVTHDAEEHAVDTDRSLDDVRRVAFAAFGIEVFDLLTAELACCERSKFVREWIPSTSLNPNGIRNSMSLAALA